MPLYNPPVLPFDNLIINGGMRLAQRGTTFAAPVTSAYTLDRYVLNYAGTVVFTISQQTDVPTFANAQQQFTNSYDVSITTADAAIAAGDFGVIRQAVEGYRFAPLAQRPLFMCFWVRSAKTGIHCVSLRNSGADRSCVLEYTVNVADTWEYKTLIIPASPTAGTWDFAAGVGLNVGFALACGSTYQTAPNAWNVGNFLGTANQVNEFDTIGNRFRVTGVWVGDLAGPQQFIERPFAQDLELAQRYYEKSFVLATAPVQNVGLNTGEYQWPALVAGAVAQNSPRVLFKTRKRAAPTMVGYNPAAVNAEARDIAVPGDCSASVFSSSQDTGFYPQTTGNAATAVNNRLRWHWTADAEL